MSRKHFASLAWELRQAHEDFANELTLESDARWAADRQWDLSVLAVADACAEFNGNFDRARFLIAAGYTHRPDGSMFPMAAPR